MMKKMLRSPSVLAVAGLVSLQGHQLMAATVAPGEVIRLVLAVLVAQLVGQVM